MAGRRRHAGDLADEWHECDRGGAVGPFNPGPSWHVQGTGDYNGDNKSDILWQPDNGTPAIWPMNGMNFVAAAAAGSFNPGHDWHVIA